MCKFHQDVAIDIATRPDGTIDTLALAINLVALGANCSINTYTPQLPDISGYDTYQLASQRGQQAFAQTGLVYDAEEFAAYRAETQELLRTKTAAAQQGLRLEKPATKNLKTSAQTIRFLANAPDALYEPFSTHGVDVFQNEKDAKKFQEIRRAAMVYWADPEVQKVLNKRFKQSVTTVFTEAPKHVNKTLLAVYELTPDQLKPLNTCVKGFCTAAGGTFLGHIGCVAKVAFSSLLLGSSSSIINDQLLMYGMMTAGSVLGTAAWEYWYYKRGIVPTTLERGITYGVSLLTLGGFIGYHALSHGEHSDHEAHSHNTPTALHEWKTDRDIVCRPTKKIPADSVLFKPIQNSPQ